MRHSRSAHRVLRLAALLLPGSLTGAGCDRLATSDGDETVATATATPQDPEPPPADQTPHLRIYYDLTRYDWYAQGEPLVLDGEMYTARTGLLASPAENMERVGEYHGVDAYVTADDDSTVYVPIFPNYWQPFVRSGPARTPD
jgi:hypothetical protein